MSKEGYLSVFCVCAYPSGRMRTATRWDQPRGLDASSRWTYSKALAPVYAGRVKQDRKEVCRAFREDAVAPRKYQLPGIPPAIREGGVGRILPIYAIVDFAALLRSSRSFKKGNG